MNRLAELPSSSSDVADVVEKFYDRYPYPRPIDNLEQYRQLWADPERRRADYHLMWPDKPYQENQTILIAGCGTSQAAKHALRWPNAKVTAIDVSATSVSCTEELKRKYNLNNLQIRQIAIEQIEQLEMSFDQIVCTGVLHHLKDPDAGLAALHSVLKVDGAMHLMVYAPYGRAGIYMLQEFCRRMGIGATDEGIRDLIVALRLLPPGHPLEHILHEAPDFGRAAALADSLLHPQDRAYSVPQLFNFIERGQLTFGRWVKQAPYTSCCGVIAQLPHAAHLANLSPEEQYAAIELFRGTMVRHSLIAYRADKIGGPYPICFADDVWQSYVPIRMSDTTCVQERLPIGAAAALINRNHSFKDIFMTLDSVEKRLFDAVDGNHTIGQILENALTSTERSHPSLGINFFQRLWWHDQVVFDASRL